ncbi:Protoheme IX farnesyltransferase [Zostera marina]|uniref:Heme O synthase n=1 Tax=Zostera marina TaxID=29655 RepID=A0A0K9NVP1_ZOSMR|nr:Protoheme IX farnesyltransferase [Zostera marina]
MWRKGGGVVSSSRFLLSSRSQDGSLALSSSARIFSSSSFPTASSTEAVQSSASADTPSLISSVVRHYGRCYWELSKARLSMLVVATSGTGFVMGSGNYVDVAGLCCTCAGTMMVAASANSLNQVFERENDAKMKRTALRPLPSGRISISHAATWATTVGITGTSLLAWNANMLAAGLAASNLVLYAFIYTPLKQIHPINTWVGAVVGAIPPLLGWAAASGEISYNSMILPAALYFWQIPHFMALAYLCRADYVAGGFRMISLKDVSGYKTAMVSLRNCLYLLPLGYVAYDWGIASGWIFPEYSLLTLGMTAASILFVRERNTKNARRMFHFSLLYLPVFMSGLLLHRIPNSNKDSLHVAYDDNTATIVENNGEHNDRKRNKITRVSLDEPIRPPVAYASIAPFPFLPAPLYIPQNS